MVDTESTAKDGSRDRPEPHVTGNGASSLMGLGFVVPPVRSAVSKVLSEAPIPGLPTRSRGSTAGRRSTAKDGLENQIEWLVTTNGTVIWSLLQAIPPVRVVNRALTNLSILKFPTRPEPLSTMADYTSWDSLIDRTWSSRHLPPAAAVASGLPDVSEFEDLFTREEFIESPKSTVLFSYFAQWFTDGFLHSDRGAPGRPPDMRRNESNHEVDLTNLYGLNPDVTRQLRALEGGLLKSQLINGEEFPLYLCRNGKRKPEFSLIEVLRFDDQPLQTRNKLFAMGSDTSNLQVGFVLHNVLFLREHNRIARLLGAEYPAWDDERLFATTRNIMVVLLMKIVVEDYINHITPLLFKLRLQPELFPNERWYRQNWMSVEFQLLYRWHSLVPPTYHIRGEEIPIRETLFNTEIVTTNGLGALFEDASEQVAGRVGLGNTPPELWYVEAASIEQARAVQLRSYNDYRELAGYPRVTEFNQITGDIRVREALRRLYGHVDNIEFYIGLFAEELPDNSVLPGLIGRMVALDAFSQVYTNPLLAPRVFNDETFSPLGMEIIRSTTTLSQLVNRNVPERPGGYFVSMTRKDWKRT